MTKTQTSTTISIHSLTCSPVTAVRKKHRHDFDSKIDLDKCVSSIVRKHNGDDSESDDKEVSLPDLVDRRHNGDDSDSEADEQDLLPELFVRADVVYANHDYDQLQEQKGVDAADDKDDKDRDGADNETFPSQI
jgi:hypothetical protein